MKKLLPLAASAFMLTICVTSAQIIVNEDFNYADTAAMQVNWGAVGLGTLNATNGNPLPSAEHPGGTVNSWVGSAISVTPTPTEFVRLTADIYDDGTSANKRMTVGLRGGPFPLFEMGMYNNPSHYAVRLALLAGNEGWLAFPDQGSFVNAPTTGWHRFTVDIFDTQTIISFDLFADGIVDSTLTSLGAAGTFTDLRFGGPSNVTSGGGGALFDNIVLEVLAVPEPSGFMLGALGLLALAARRRIAR